MERLVRIAKKLRLENNFNGYIHLKTIPGASQELLTEAGLYADRMSINLEMPTEAGLKLLAPDKSHEDVKPLVVYQGQYYCLADEKKIIKHVPKFVPAGQSTQMVIGATPETDMESCTAPTNTIKITISNACIIRVTFPSVMMTVCR
jgi:predicted DNA-binding helix-hairpin-helix protein